jgi:hypothetical protein
LFHSEASTALSNLEQAVSAALADSSKSRAQIPKMNRRWHLGQGPPNLTCERA